VVTRRRGLRRRWSIIRTTTTTTTTTAQPCNHCYHAAVIAVRPFTAAWELKIFILPVNRPNDKFIINAERAVWSSTSAVARRHLVTDCCLCFFISPSSSSRPFSVAVRCASFCRVYLATQFDAIVDGIQTRWLTLSIRLRSAAGCHDRSCTGESRGAQTHSRWTFCSLGIQLC